MKYGSTAAGGAGGVTGGPTKGRPPLGSMQRFRAAVSMMTKGTKTASAKGTAAMAAAMRKKKKK